MAWGNGNEIYSLAGIRAQAKKRAKIARKASKREKQATFDDQVESAIAAGIPVTIIPYQGKPHYNHSKPRKRDKIAELEATIAILKRERPQAPIYRHGMGSEFYSTREWRSIRYDVIRSSDGKCKECGRSRADGIIIHIDHIKPRSKFPELELLFANLQVLCEDCNIGKSNK